MTDILQTGLEWLSAQNKTHRASSVTYYRGAASVALTATIGKTVHKIPEANGVYLKTETIDWLILSADLILSGSVVEPAPGDQILWTDSKGKIHTYEVRRIGDEQCFRFSDPGRKSLRIHTQQIDET